MSKENSNKGVSDNSKRVPVFDHALPPVQNSTPMPKVKPAKSGG